MSLLILKRERVLLYLSSRGQTGTPGWRISCWSWWGACCCSGSLPRRRTDKSWTFPAGSPPGSAAGWGDPSLVAVLAVVAEPEAGAGPWLWSGADGLARSAGECWCWTGCPGLSSAPSGCCWWGRRRSLKPQSRSAGVWGARQKLAGLSRHCTPAGGRSSAPFCSCCGGCGGEGWGPGRCSWARQRRAEGGGQIWTPDHSSPGAHWWGERALWPSSSSGCLVLLPLEPFLIGWEDLKQHTHFESQQGASITKLWTITAEL